MVEHLLKMIENIVYNIIFRIRILFYDSLEVYNNFKVKK
jgi:hypothetical protein